MLKGGCVFLRQSMRAVVAVVCFVAASFAQQSKQVPVYPGAMLAFDQGEGEEPECCSFETSDPFDKVLAFYEAQLKTKALDTKSLTARYPKLKPQIQQLEQQMPKGFQMRAFVLNESSVGPVLFEVASSGKRVMFTIPNESMTQKDSHFAKEWREKTGKVTEADVAEQRAKEEAGQEQVAAEERTKEELEYTAKMAVELTSLLKQRKINPSPVMQCEKVERLLPLDEGQRQFSDGYVFYFTTPDDFIKVFDVYASQLKRVDFDGKNLQKDAPLYNYEGNGAGWGAYDFAHFWRQAAFQQDCIKVNVLEMNIRNDGPKTVGVEITVTAKCADISKMKRLEEGHF